MHYTRDDYVGISRITGRAAIQVRIALAHGQRADDVVRIRVVLNVVDGLRPGNRASEPEKSKQARYGKVLFTRVNSLVKTHTKEIQIELTTSGKNMLLLYLCLKKM